MSSVFGAAVRIAYDADGRQAYLGEAASKDQNKVSSPVWRIKKIIYEGSTTKILAILWAQGSSDFKFAWTFREGYPY
jgi:hypothetical protein